MQLTKKNEINAKTPFDVATIKAISQKLNQLLDENDLPVKVLSEATNVSIALINMLRRGDGNPTIGTLNAICTFFNISLAELLGFKKDEMQKSVKAISIYDLRFEAEKSEPIGKFLIEIPKNTDPDSIFGITINNNALLPLYEKGTTFILTSSQVALDGDIVAVKIHNHINALKRIFIKKDNYYLKNINPDDYIEAYDKKDIHILGVVIQIIQKIIS